MAIPGPYTPPPAPPAPPKRSNALPIILALVAVFGFCLVAGIGGFAGYRWLSAPATNVPDVPPSVVRSYEDGWKRYQLGSIGMTVDLPVDPERFEIQPESTVSLYDRNAGYEVYSEDFTIDLYAYRQKMGGALTPVELAEDHAGTYVDAEAEGLTQQLTPATLAGQPAAYADFAYRLDGGHEHVRTATILVGRAEYVLVVLDFGATPEEAKRNAVRTMDRIVKSLELKPETSAMMK